MLVVRNSYTIVMVVHTYHSRLTSMQDYELAVKVKPSGGYETLDFILSFLEHTKDRQASKHVKGKTVGT